MWTENPRVGGSIPPLLIAGILTIEPQEARTAVLGNSCLAL